MKLLYVLNHYSRNESSHFVHVLSLVEALGRRGISVLLVIEKGTDVPLLSGANVEVIALREPRRVRRFLRLLRIVRSAVGRGYRTVFVRIAVPATLVALVACLGTGARVFYWQSGTVHAADRAKHRGLSRIAWLLGSWWPFRLAVRGVHRFVTAPESMVRYYRDEVGVPASKILNLYNDIDIDRFRASVARHDRLAERSRLGADDGTAVLLFVHRLSPVRRTLDYVPALLGLLEARAPTEWILVFAGGGPELPALATAIAQSGLGDRCRLLGDVPSRELHRLYGAADIFVNPSYAEGFPRVILEAMAVGLPIVTTDAGGTAELLGSLQQQFVVSRDSPVGFAEAVIRMMGDRQLRAILTRENDETVRRFDTSVVAEAYERELFGGRG